jgi:hypothetical protein
MYSPLIPILEYQKIKPTNNMFQSAMTSKSMIDKFAKEKIDTTVTSIKLNEDLMPK